jgi:hypothetical protein
VLCYEEGEAVTIEGEATTVTCVHVVTIGIKHDRLTMNRQNTARHGVTACAKEGGRRDKRTEHSYKKRTDGKITELGQFFTVSFNQNTFVTSDTRPGVFVSRLGLI